ncbi:MAG TPA: 1-acyl-sn-glycerol-3-phosphate acyltransferase, partial [Bacteroidia bacterium]|nr:1-acyl-sn-glycerol-3-phosphate acyltransferase [Bacteroidia bacterium]
MLLGNFLNKFNSFWLRNKILFFFSLLLFLGVAAAGILRLKISESIFSTLPKGESFAQFNKLIESKNIVNQVVFSIKPAKETDADEIQQTLDVFGDSLKRVSGNLLTDVATTRPDVEQQVYSYYYSNFPFLIDSAYYKLIDEKLLKDSISESVNASYRQLISPGSPFLKQFILNDPLFISGKFFQELNSINNSQGFIVDDGIVYSKDKKQIFITAKTTFDKSDSEKNILLYKKLHQFEKSWNEKYPDNPFDFFGTFEIAAENAMQVTSDAMTTLVIALILIVLILFIYYRRLLIPLYFILPAVFGSLFALGIIGFFKPEVSAISLSTSAVLLGIILDYAFHFFTHIRHTRSISLTVKEMSAPMIIGSFTTITAFSALLFTNSQVLKDFGLFAALSLSAAAFFTLTGLPVLLKIFRFDYKNMPAEFTFFKLPVIGFSPKIKYACLLIIALLTVVLFFPANNIKFDSDLENLSYHTQDLKLKEQELVGINPQFEKKIYLFVENENFENAATANFYLFEKLTDLKKHNEVNNFLSAAPFFIPENVKTQRAAQWKNYWNNHKENVFEEVDQHAGKLGFNTNAFNGFKDWINLNYFSEINKDSLVRLLSLDNLVDTQNGKTRFISTIVVKNENLVHVKSQLRAIKGVDVFDNSETASSMLSLVKNDFNYLLLASSLIVFFTMLLIYGRIELTLLTFLPMLVSWIWILGIASLLDIKFNFVNVVIATFIFGLGDDFCIFITDGLLHKYKYGKNTLSSYRAGIILSAISTIVGTGVLFFAKHPAIHSVAAISVLGITIILFISFVFQPVIFDLFVQKRIERKKTPVSLFTFIISVIEFSYFVVGCILFYFIGFILISLPLAKKKKREMMNVCLSFFAMTVLYIGIHVRKQIFDRQNLQIKKPSIIIANHSSFLDILLMIMLHPKIIILVKDWVYNSPLFGYFVRYAGYIYTETGTEQNLEEIKKRIADGYSLVIFPEGTRSPDGEIKRFHKGAFYLAQQLEIDITPVLIHGASYTLPKGEFLVKHGELNLKILPRIKFEDKSYGETYRDRAKNITAYFKHRHKLFTDERESAKYLWNRVFQNYIFKGPVLEWYIRIKWKLESDNFQQYHEIIGNRENITDMGCGYGYLSFYLHYKNPDRKILGIDYDDEKIEIANNNFDKTANLQFESADITEYKFKEKQDVIFMNDVLHYLTEQSQK